MAINSATCSLISEKGLSKIKKPCVISYTITTDELTYTKTFPITKSDYCVDRIIDIGVYATRQLLQVSQLKSLPEGQRYWVDIDTKVNWPKFVKERTKLDGTLLWRFVWKIDRMRDWIVQKVIDYYNWRGKKLLK